MSARMPSFAKKSTISAPTCPGRTRRHSAALFRAEPREAIVEDAHGDIVRKIEDIAGILGKEKNHLEKYGIILDRRPTAWARHHDDPRHPSNYRNHGGRHDDDRAEQADRRFDHRQVTELEQVKAKLRNTRSSPYDPLTQIWNRRAFDRAAAAIYDNNRSVIFSALILADIDCFKEVNDRHGHPVGDKILQHVANIFRSSAPTGAFVARTGGEGFAIIVEGLTEDATVRMADEIRLMIEKTPFIGGSMGVNREPVTISMGVCMASEGTGPDDLYSKADRALYASKSNGRNRVSKFPVEETGKQRKNWLIYRKD